MNREEKKDKNHNFFGADNGQDSELGVRLQNNVASRACASFSNGVASRAIAYFSTKKIRVISLSRHRVSR